MRRNLTDAAFWILAVLVLLWTVLPPPRAWVESLYSHGLYRWIAGCLVPVGDLAPFSLGALALVLVIPLGSVLLLRSLQRRRRQRTPWGRWSFRGLRKLAASVVVGYAAFLLVWGANYRRQPVEVQLQLDEGEIDTDEVHSFVERLVAMIERDAPTAGERDVARALASVRESLSRFLEDLHGHPPPLPTRVKALPAGFLLSFATSGTIVPVFLEAQTDAAMTDDWFLGVAAHELAHVAGYAGEADADLIGTIAGLRAEDPFARYAAALHALGRFLRALPRNARESVRSALPRVARSDLEARRKVALRYRRAGLVHLHQKVYDVYLHSQGVEAGIEDYSRTVELLVRARRKSLLPIAPRSE